MKSPAMKKRVIDLKTINIAFCGCGMVAREHLKHLSDFRTRVVAVYNNPGHLESAREFAGLTGCSCCTDDLKRIAEDPNIDAVYICNWHHDRVAMIETLAAAGKALFVEKPLALREPDLLKIAAILREHRIHFHAGFKNRFHSSMIAARRMMPAPEVIFSHVADVRWEDGSRSARPDIGGGHIVSQGIYGFEAAYLLAGARPVSVCAAGRIEQTADGVHGPIACVFEFANGAVANVMVTDTGLATSALSKFFVEMSTGGNFLTLSKRYTELLYRNEYGTEECYRFVEDGFRNQSRVFLDDLRCGNPSSCSFLEGAIPSVMAFRALESVKTNRKVRIDLSAFCENG